MTEFEHQKELLKAKIDAHVTILGLEIRAAHATFDPVGTALSLLGVDRSVVQILLPVLRAVTTNIGQHHAPEAAEGADAAT